MLNYKETIQQYLQDNFVQGNPDHAGHLKLTTHQLLFFLFDTFPKGCISDYEINEILIDLGFKRMTWVEENSIVEEEDDEETHTIKKRPVLGWCLKHIDFDFADDVHTVPIDR